MELKILCVAGTMTNYWFTIVVVSFFCKETISLSLVKIRFKKKL